MQVFTLAVLPSHPTQIPFLTKNVTVQVSEDRPHYNGLLVLPIRKGKGGKVSFIVRLHSCRPPCGAHLGREFLNEKKVS